MSADQKSEIGLSMMRDLEVCEDDIQALVRIAEETVVELQRLPECNAESIEQLSSAYLNKLKAVQETLKSHSQVLVEPPSTSLDAKRASDTEAHLKREQEDIAQSLKLLEDK
jgi:hypothetical protein